MSRHLLAATVLFSMVSGAEPVAQEPDLTGVEILTHRVRGNIYMLEATKDVAGNIAVSVGPDGVLLVDSQYPELRGSILAALRKLHDGPVRYIINTHHHDDHSEGNAALGRKATLIGSDNTRIRLSKRPNESKPIITFGTELSLHFNGEEIRLVHFPSGHSDTDVIVFFTKSNVVHLGDLFNGGVSSFPSVDLAADGTIKGIIDVIAKVIEMIPEDAAIIPGHYEVSNLADLKICHQMLIDTVEFVRAEKEAGYTLEQIQEKGLPAKYSNWGKTGYTGAEQWIENIFRGL
jgi:glyoxylase-like metal-dependent hydrolase (beta-lactamase superfamily II)